MHDARSHVERATAGLVLALFLIATLLVGYIFFRMTQNHEARTAPAEEATSQFLRFESRHAETPETS